MAKMMSVALPVIAIAGAAFTGGSSLGLLGADAAGTAATAGGLDAIVGAGASGAAMDAGMVDSAATATSGAGWLGSTLASVGSYAKPVAMAAQAGGTALQANAAIQAGDAQKAEANFQANQLNANADEQQAAAQQKMVQQNKEATYVLSNAQAAAAAGGGSATDPTVVKDMQTIAGEGRYRALTSLYQGDAQAQAMNNQAAATRAGGNLAAQAGNTKMYSTILGGASSLYDKYATIGPDEKKQNYSGYPPATFQPA